MGLFHDWKRAVWRVPLHIIASAPVAAATMVPIAGPKIGTAYVNWRTKAEQDDVATGKDSAEKSEIDLYTQTALVKGVLKVWGK